VFAKRPTNHKDDKCTKQTSRGTNPTLRHVGSDDIRGMRLWMRHEAWGFNDEICLDPAMHRRRSAVEEDRRRGAIPR